MNDTIQLPPFIIAELYKNSLVEIMNEEDAILTNEVELLLSGDTETEDKNDEALYMGKNGKQVSIVVNSSTERFINVDDLVFLTSILKACKLKLDDIAIFNIQRTPVDYNYLKDTALARHVLVFGIEPTDIKLPFIIPHFQVQQYAGCTIVIAPGLSLMNKSNAEGKLLKTKLWMSLQRCFNLS